MTLIGDPGAWLDHFRTLDQRLLDRVGVVWPSCCAKLSGQPIEDKITINLVDLLSKDTIVRRLCHWVGYQHEPFGLLPDGTKFSKGKIDMAAFFDQERERYLAYECKRLNVHNNGSRRSLATQYVVEGMMRFITEQYAEGLPVGCMLGYVMDGDTAFAQSQVNNVIVSHGPLSLTGDPEALPETVQIGRFRTGHIRSGGGAIELRHALLAYT